MKSTTRTKLDILKHDHEMMKEYFSTKNYEMLDSRISEIMSSKDLNRMYGVLLLFKEHKSDLMFKSCLQTIENKLKGNGFDLR